MPKFALSLLALFGGLGVVLTAAGIYGLLAYSVNLRVREFGIRAALGATPRAITAMILREVAGFTLPGLAMGVGLSLAFASVMKSFVYRLSPVDPWSLSGAALFLAAAALLSAWLPAQRASKVELEKALRTQS